MYGYYLLAALGPRIQPYLWWKKYLTALQMIQFVLVMVHAFQLLFTKCDYPKAFVWWIGLHSILFFYLFKTFYVQAYTKKILKDMPASIKEEKTALMYNNNAHNLLTSKKENGIIYSNEYKLTNDLTIDNSLRNRVFINSH